MPSLFNFNPSLTSKAKKQYKTKMSRVQSKFACLRAKCRGIDDIGTRPGNDRSRDDTMAPLPFRSVLADDRDLAAVSQAIHEGILGSSTSTTGAGVLVQADPGGGKSTLLKALALHYKSIVCAQVHGRDVSGHGR